VNLALRHRASITQASQQSTTAVTFRSSEGKNGRRIIGTGKDGANAYLVEYDPTTQQMRMVVDCMREIGSNATGLAAQSAIHTRNNAGASGKIYFGTSGGCPTRAKAKKSADYPGGYPMVYDPATETTRVYPIPVPHQGIISITPDESRNIAYISTRGREQLIESSHFLKLDLLTGAYQDLGETHYVLAFIVVDYRGRAYHPLLGGEILRYDPKTDKVERLKQTIDDKPPTPESRLAMKNPSHQLGSRPQPQDAVRNARIWKSALQLRSYRRRKHACADEAWKVDSRRRGDRLRGDVCFHRPGSYGRECACKTMRHGRFLTLSVSRPAAAGPSIMGRWP